MTTLTLTLEAADAERLRRMAEDLGVPAERIAAAALRGELDAYDFERWGPCAGKMERIREMARKAIHEGFPVPGE